jgi:hypothetical protein
VSSCQSQGNLTILGDLSNDLKEVSAVAYYKSENHFWIIEDSGNKNEIFALDQKGDIVKSVVVTNAENRDWEDLTFDKKGNLYVGDFGNNSKDQILYTIYRINHESLKNREVSAEKIDFFLPPEHNPEDFEAFFLRNNSIYLFSKDNKITSVYKVPNLTGKHEAIFITEYNLPGKHNKVTSADISDDGKTAILLNHDKLWKLTNFNGEDYFSGHIEKLVFKHDSQKEGVCFKTDSTVVITDERNGSEGGNFYEFNLLENKKGANN